MELGLWRDMELNGSIRQSRGTMAYFNATELDGIARKLLTTNELRLLTHLLHNLVLLLFGSTLHALCQRLLGEALLIDAVDGIANMVSLGTNERNGIFSSTMVSSGTMVTC